MLTICLQYAYMPYQSYYSLNFPQEIFQVLPGKINSQNDLLVPGLALKTNRLLKI